LAAALGRSELTSRKMKGKSMNKQIETPSLKDLTPIGRHRREHPGNHQEEESVSEIDAPAQRPTGRQMISQRSGSGATLRELIPHGGQRKERTMNQIAAAARMGLDYPVTQVGVVGNITVYYDPSLGAQGLAMAQQMLNTVSAPYNDMQTDFGVAGGATSVVIAPLSGKNDGSGGAYHHGCDFTSGGVLYLDATFASTSVNPLNLEVALYVAELSEAFMGTQGKGWGCGYSNGEALSRFLAEQETPDGTINAFMTGPAWDKAGRPDWISKTENTDQDSVSTGCGIVYLYWMRSLGFTIPQITQAGGATLAANYKTLTGKTTAFSDLISGLSGVTITSDDPFNSKASTVVCNSDGRLEVFGVGMDKALWHIWQTAPHAGPWSAWSSLSGGIDSFPAVAVNVDGRLEAFVRGNDNALWHMWQTAPHAGPWSAWSSLGGTITSNPAVFVNSDGRLEVFARGTDDALWHIWQTAPHAGPWSAWSSLGGVITSDPVVVDNSDGRLEVFARGTDKALWHVWQTVAHGGPWSAWSSLGGIITSEGAVALNTDGRLEIFARGTDRALWHNWQTAPHAGPWSGWSSLGGIITSGPAVYANSDGRLEVFARGTDNALWHIWQTMPHAGPWSTWGSLGGVITSDPAVVDNSDGRLEVFARGTDDALWHIWQTAAHAAPWSAWASLGGILKDEPTVS
jgi:acylphosphatase